MFSRINLFLLSKSNPEDVCFPPQTNKVRGEAGASKNLTENVRTVNPLHGTSLQPRRIPLNPPLRPNPPLLHRVSSNGPLPHPPRPGAAHASSLPNQTCLARGLLRIPQPSARLARLHRIPPLHPAADSSQPLAPLVDPPQPEDPWQLWRHRHFGRGRLRGVKLPPRAYLRHMSQGDRRRGRGHGRYIHRHGREGHRRGQSI